MCLNSDFHEFATLQLHDVLEADGFEDFDGFIEVEGQMVFVVAVAVENDLAALSQNFLQQEWSRVWSFFEAAAHSAGVHFDERSHLEACMQRIKGKVAVSRVSFVKDIEFGQQVDVTENVRLDSLNGLHIGVEISLCVSHFIIAVVIADIGQLFLAGIVDDQLLAANVQTVAIAEDIIVKLAVFQLTEAVVLNTQIDLDLLRILFLQAANLVDVSCDGILRNAVSSLQLCIAVVREAEGNHVFLDGREYIIFRAVFAVGEDGVCM